MQAKRASESMVCQAQIVMSAHINGAGRLFGGTLMEWIDVVAAVAARRHSGRDVTTACVDTLEFCAPAHANDTIMLEAKLTYVGKTSMEVRVDTYVEELSGARRLINTAYLVLVALDGNEQPTEVPPLLPETDEERREWEAGKCRREIRKARKKERY